MVKVLLVDRQGSIEFSNLKVALEENVPLAVANTLESLVPVGRFNMLAISEEIREGIRLHILGRRST